MAAKEKIMVPRAKTKQSSRVVLLTVKRAKPSSRVVLLTEEGGLSELEESTTRPAEPGEEEPEAASRRLGRTISCSVRDTADAILNSCTSQLIQKSELMEGGGQYISTLPFTSRLI